MEKITYKKSMLAKLILGQDSIPAYQSIKDLCATHKKVSTRLSFGKETISFGRIKVAAIKIVVKNIHLYLALNPKDYENTKYNFKDLSETKIGQVYPMRVRITGSRSLKYALELLEDALANVGATDVCEAENVNYEELFYPRGFDVLLEQGLIKKYVKSIEEASDDEEDDFLDDVLDDEEDLVEAEEMCNVHFTAKLMYEAVGAADDLYIITSYTNWDPMEAVPMQKNADTTFTATMSFPKGTALEFKICRSKNWTDVEKGIWKEEIVNHNYILVEQDMDVEDLIYNFRQM